MVSIKRIAEKELLENLNEFPAVAILGPRQCGKSTLSRMILEKVDKEIIYVDADRPSDRNKLQDAELFFDLHKDKLICIDEIQRLPDIFQIIRSDIDINRQNGRFLLLGSASKDLIRQSSETLAGRIIYEQLTPFLFPEISTKKELNDYWLKGGFPLSLLTNTDKSSYNWRNSFIQTFLERDIPQLGFNIPAETLRRLWQMIAHWHGQIVNYSSIGNSLGISHTSVRNYLDLLSETFMIRLLQPYAKNVGKRLIKSPKVYIRDPGVLHCLLQVFSFDDLMGHPVFGASWEGIVIENLISLSPKWNYSYYRTSNGAELDLVLTFGQKTIAVECKATKSPQLTRGFWNASEDIKPDETWIVAPVTDSYPIKENTFVLPLKVALEKLQKLQH